MKKFGKLTLIMTGVIAVLLVAAVFFAMKSSSQGVELTQLENKAYDLESQNQEIQTQIVSASSLSLIGKEAQTLGMTSPSKYVYLNRDGVALRGVGDVSTLP